MRLPSFIWDRLLIAYATGRLPSFVARRVQSSIARDRQLAAAYDAVCHLERMASTTPAALTRGQLDRLQAAILDGAPSGDAATARPAARMGRASTFASLGAAAAAAVIFLVVGERAEPLVARGDRGREGREPLGVKASCLASDGARLIDSATVGAGRSVDRLDCPVGSLVAFTTTNLGSETRHLFIVGVNHAGERRWYEPFGPQARAVAVPAGAVDEPLSPVADTAGMVAEPVTLYVLIAERAVSAGDVERDLSSALDHGVPIGRLDKLPLDVAVQARIELAP